MSIEVCTLISVFWRSVMDLYTTTKSPLPTAKIIWIPTPRFWKIIGYELKQISLWATQTFFKTFQLFWPHLKNTWKEKSAIFLYLVSQLLVFLLFFVAVPPTAVWIDKKEQHLLSGREVVYNCGSTGSSPRSKFTWFLGEDLITTTSSDDIQLHQVSSINVLCTF